MGKQTLILMLFFLLFSVSLKSQQIAKIRTEGNACKSQSCRMPSRLKTLNDKVYTTTKGSDSLYKEMVFIKGGEFLMGSDEFEDSKPVHKVKVNSFWMDEHEVTNKQFAAFVAATGYVTVAEREMKAEDFPGVAKENLIPGSAVFVAPKEKVQLDNPYRWWQYVNGANWRHPEGPESSIEHKDDEPVVQVCYEDAAAYARWVGKRLPTEAEWEYAAKSGKNFKKYYWGNEIKPKGKWAANIFQGDFPHNNIKEDGYELIAPVKSFPPNSFGIYDLEGNVWEWCSDLYRPDYYKNSPNENPQGPSESFDPEEPGIKKHVQRGGSFLCSDQYCIRYKAGSRGKGETLSAGNNLGFRCVKD